MTNWLFFVLISTSQAEEPASKKCIAFLKAVLEKVEAIGAPIFNPQPKPLHEFRKNRVSPMNFFGASPIVYSNLRALLRLGSLTKMASCAQGCLELHDIFDPRAPMGFLVRQQAKVMIAEDFLDNLSVLENKLADIEIKLSNERALPEKSLWEIVFDVHHGDLGRSIDFMTLFAVMIDSNAYNLSLIREFSNKYNPSTENNSQPIKRVVALQTRIATITKLVREQSNGRLAFEFPEFKGTDYPIVDGKKLWTPHNYDQSYHFWLSAYIARELRRRGFDENIAAYMPVLFGDTYEKMSIPFYVVIAPVIALAAFFFEGDPIGPVRPAHALNHIGFYVRGALFGISGNISTVPSQAEAREFVRKNVWSHYRDIAYGDFGIINPRTEFLKSFGRGNFQSLLTAVDRDKYLLAALLWLCLK